MKYTLIILCLIASPAFADLDLSVGLSISDEKGARPEVSLPNPLGIIRVEYETENTVTFCEHISSMSYHEHGGGLNHCGLMLKLTPR